MWKSNKAPDDDTVQSSPRIMSEPPRAVELQRTGEIEVLRPLILRDIRAKRESNAFRSFRSPNPLWFRRFLVVGSVALVMIGLVLVSAILVGINDQVAGPEVTTNVIPDDEPAQPEEPFNVEAFSPPLVEPAPRRVEIVHSNPRRRPVRPRVHLAAARPKLHLHPLPQPEQPKFVPTTLVIYAENGVINTRIEPWLQASY